MGEFGKVSLWRGFDGSPSIVVDFLRAAVWRPGSVMRLFEVGGLGGLAARAWDAEIIKVGGNLIGRNDIRATAPKKKGSQNNGKPARLRQKYPPYNGTCLDRWIVLVVRKNGNKVTSTRKQGLTEYMAKSSCMTERPYKLKTRIFEYFSKPSRENFHRGGSK